VAAGFARLHTTGDMNRTRKKQQLFCESGFTRVWVRDDRERAAAFDLGGELRHVLACGDYAARHCSKGDGRGTLSHSYSAHRSERR
jgi:hypothetical protein